MRTDLSSSQGTAPLVWVCVCTYTTMRMCVCVGGSGCFPVGPLAAGQTSTSDPLTVIVSVMLFTSCLVFGGLLLRNATINGVQPRWPDQKVEMDKVIKAGTHNQRTETEHLQKCLSGYTEMDT